MSLTTIPQIEKLEHNAQQLKNSITSLVKLSKKILEFSLEKSGVKGINLIEKTKSQVKSYKKTLCIEPDRMYRVHYDLYARIFIQNREYILKNPVSEHVEDAWIRKTHIDLILGSNLNNPKNILMPLSTVYNYSVDIYKNYYEDSKYNKECCYVDLFILNLYQIFTSFNWTTEENQQLRKIENYIKNDILKITKIETSSVSRSQSLSSFLTKIPILVEKFASSMGGNNSEMGSKIKEFSQGAKKLLSDPNVSDLMLNMFTGLGEDINSAKGDPTKMLENAFNRIGSDNFSQKLQKTVQTHLENDNMLKE